MEFLPYTSEIVQISASRLAKIGLWTKYLDQRYVPVKVGPTKDGYYTGGYYREGSKACKYPSYVWHSLVFHEEVPKEYLGPFVFCNGYESKILLEAIRQDNLSPIAEDELLTHRPWCWINLTYVELTKERSSLSVQLEEIVTRIRHSKI